MSEFDHQKALTQASFVGATTFLGNLLLKTENDLPGALENGIIAYIAEYLNFKFDLNVDTATLLAVLTNHYLQGEPVQRAMFNANLGNLYNNFGTFLYDIFIQPKPDPVVPDETQPVEEGQFDAYF